VALLGAEKLFRVKSLAVLTKWRNNFKRQSGNSEFGFNFVVLRTDCKQQMVHTTLHVVTTVLAADSTHHTSRGHYCISSRWYTPHFTWSLLYQAADGTHHTSRGHYCISSRWYTPHFTWSLLYWQRTVYTTYFT
jgi:hypothetical protein